MKNKKIIASMLLMSMVSLSLPAMADCPSCVPCAPQVSPSVSEISPCVNGAIKIEHLMPVKNAKVDLVQVSENNNILMKGDLIPAYFIEKISTKTLNCGDEVQLSLPCGLKTVEGTQLLPPGTSVIANVQELQKPKSFSRSAKLKLAFNKFILPNGIVIPVCAYPNTKNQILRKSKWKETGRIALWTLGGMAVGAGAGTGIGFAASSVCVGTFVGLAIGGGSCLIIASALPGLHYKAKQGDVLYLQLEDNLVIPSNLSTIQCQCPTTVQ